MTQIDVRKAQSFDAGAMVSLLNDIIAAGGMTALTTSVTSADLRDWMHESGAWHLAEVGGDICGFQWIGPHVDLAPDTCDIATFVALGEHGVGIGSALFRATCAAARTLGYRRINAVIHADNGGGLAYYRSRGFETVGHLKNLTLPDGRTVNKVITTYRL